MYIDAKYLKDDVSIRIEKYRSGGICLRLISETEPHRGESAAVATVNIPDAPAPEGHAWMKGWSENEGIPEALEAAGVIKLLPTFQPTGFARAQLAQIL